MNLILRPPNHGNGKLCWKVTELNQCLLKPEKSWSYFSRQWPISSSTNYNIIINLKMVNTIFRFYFQAWQGSFRTTITGWYSKLNDPCHISITCCRCPFLKASASCVTIKGQLLLLDLKKREENRVCKYIK
jgi:hypothetical protein